MLANRVEVVDVTELIRAVGNPELMISARGRSLIAGTLQLLTRGRRFDPNINANSLGIVGLGWCGKIVKRPDVGGVGSIVPFAWIEPEAVNDAINENCWRVEKTSNGSLNLTEPDLPVEWEVTGNQATDHGYSLRPLDLNIRDCFSARLTVDAPGSSASRKMEGSIAVFPGQAGLKKFGVVVDVDEDTDKGFVLPISSIVEIAVDLLEV